MSFFTKIRDAVQSVASVVGNYFLPGSSIVTSKLTSKGSQEQLNSTVGKLAQLGTGAAGLANGQWANYGSILSGNGLQALQGAGDTMSSVFSNPGEFLSKTATNLRTETGKLFGSETSASKIANTGITTDPMKVVLPEGWQDAPYGGIPEGAAKKTGLINSAMDWAGNNPVPALMVGQTAMATVGGIGTAQANAEQARLNREAQLQMPTVQRQANMNPSAWSGGTPFSAADPNAAVDMQGRYIRGPRAGQYAPGREPGLINSARA